MLLVRPLPELGEHAAGHVLRVTEANGFASPRQLERAGWSPSAAGRDNPYRLRGPIAGLAALNFPDQFGLSPRYWNSRRCRYCVECLSQRPHWRDLWGLVFYVACHEHGCALVDQCHACDQEINWVRGSLMTCPCGASLTNCASQPASPAALHIAQLLSKAWKEEGSATSQQARDQSESLLKCIWFLGSFRAGGGRKAQKLADLHQLDEAMRITSAAGQALTEWPSGFIELIEYVQQRQGSTNSPRLTQRFGVFYRELFASRNDSWANDFRRAFESYVSATWEGQLAARNRRLNQTVRDAHEWIPATQAARSMHWRVARIRRWIDSGRLRGRTYALPSGRTAAVVYKRDLEQLQSDAQTWINLTTACQVLRLGKTHLHQMIRDGRLCPVAGPTIDGHPSWQFRQVDVRSLAANEAANLY